MGLDQETNRSDFKRKECLRPLHHIIQVLEKFSDNYEKRLNFEKLADHLNLSSSEADALLSTILQFQDLFHHTLQGHSLQKKIVDNQLYLVLEKIGSLRSIPSKIRMTKDESNLLSDVIYLFRHVKKGKGFNVDMNGTDLLSNIKKLCEYYPSLFQRTNGLVYPSEFGLKLGELILSYKKSNKAIHVLIVDDSEVTIL